MLVMGLDTSLQRCSVAILRDGGTVAHEFADMERGHAEALAPMTAAALAASGLKITDLDRVGVVAGPGGFTGIRVALAFARGLAIGASLPVVGVTSLAALAGGAEEAGGAALRAPIIDARRGQVYAALYDQAGMCRLEPFVAEPEQALQLLVNNAGNAPVVTLGTGAGLLAGAPDHWRTEGSDQIDARVIARLAAAAIKPVGPPAPVYLRAPDAKPPRPGKFNQARQL